MGQGGGDPDRPTSTASWPPNSTCPRITLVLPPQGCTAIGLLISAMHELRHANDMLLNRDASTPENLQGIIQQIDKEIDDHTAMLNYLQNSFLPRWSQCEKDCCQQHAQRAAASEAVAMPGPPAPAPTFVGQDRDDPPVLCCGNQPQGGKAAQAADKRELRTGLIEALQRRATFTRAHRGALAGKLAGDEADSSAVAFGWHQGERVCFAWHRADDQVVFISFDGRGEIVVPPQIIGTGRWPRLTADGAATAVAWESDEGFVVRIHDGKQWGPDIALPGEEAAIAFAPKGALFAATTTGLWKSQNGQFEQIEKMRYAQPALAVDASGKPHVASQQAKKIYYGTKEVAPGEQPAIVVDPKGVIHLAYLDGGAVMVRSLQGDKWSPVQVLAAKKPSWPALALGATEVRVSYLGGAQRGPDALWLVRLPDKEPVLVPSLAGNVTDAWLVTHLALRGPRDHYRPHTALISLNDVWLQWFYDAVPDGRYLFHVDPAQVFTSAGVPASNRVAIKTWHMNGGHYVVSSDSKLTVRTAWSEYFAFADSADEVGQLAAKDRRVNHNQHDLALLANSLDLPVQRPDTRYLDFPITVANLGEGASKPAKVVMLHGAELLAEAVLPALQPGQQRLVTMRLDGRLPSVRFAIRQDQPDFDPSNDELDVKLWRQDGSEQKAVAKVLLAPVDAAPGWVMGQAPAGATLVGDWHWHTTPTLLAPRSHAGPVAKGPALHYFLHAPEPLVLDKQHNLIQYVYLDLKNPPRQILLQLYEGGTQKGQRLYWGDNRIDLGAESGTRVGDLPEAGKWVRLRIPLERFGLTEAHLTGMLFGHYDGRAYWGPTTSSTIQEDREPEMFMLPEGLPQGSGGAGVKRN
jgi:hypothetical protein